MPNGHAAEVVAPARLAQRLGERGLGAPPGDLGEVVPVWKRRPADVGRYWTMATALRSLEEVDAVAFGERHVRLLPVGPPALVTADAADLAELPRGADLHHAHLEQRLDRLADLDLVRPRVHPKHDLVARLADERALFRDHGPLHDLGQVHAPSPSRAATASSAGLVITSVAWPRTS